MSRLPGIASPPTCEGGWLVLKGQGGIEAFGGKFRVKLPSLHADYQ